MKLKNGYIPMKDGNDYIIVNNGTNPNVTQLAGYNNDTAYFILQKLSESDGSMTIDNLIDIMCTEYDAPRVVIADDVKKFIDKLNQGGLLE